MGFGDFVKGAVNVAVNPTSLVFGGGNPNKGFRVQKRMAGNAWNDVTGVTAARDAARAQTQAADKATQFQQAALDKQIELNEPWRQAGLTALSDLSGGMQSGAFSAPVEEFNDPGAFQAGPDFQSPEFKFDFQADPGYEFRQKQAQLAIERSAAAGGGLFSGATLSDLARKSGEMASEEYGNAYARERGAFENNRSFNRDTFLNNRNFNYGVHTDNRNFKYGQFMDTQNQKRQALSDRFSRLSALAGLGEAGTTRMGNAASAFGQQAGDNAIGAGNARAASRVAQYNNQRDFVMGGLDLAMKAKGAK